MKTTSAPYSRASSRKGRLDMRTIGPHRTRSAYSMSKSNKIRNGLSYSGEILQIIHSTSIESQLLLLMLLMTYWATSETNQDESWAYEGLVSWEGAVRESSMDICLFRLTTGDIVWTDESWVGRLWMVFVHPDAGRFRRSFTLIVEVARPSHEWFCFQRMPQPMLTRGASSRTLYCYHLVTV